MSSEKCSERSGSGKCQGCKGSGRTRLNSPCGGCGGKGKYPRCKGAGRER
jgi:RecJ-like exonuclease